jgi:hypothetical protein
VLVDADRDSGEGSEDDTRGKKKRHVGNLLNATIVVPAYAE